MRAGPKADNIVLEESGRNIMVSELDLDRKCVSEDAKLQGGWIVRPVSLGKQER